MKYTLAQYLSAVTLRPFEKTDFYGFAGVTTDNPLIGYGEYRPGAGSQGPDIPMSPSPQPNAHNGFTLIVDGNDIQVINDSTDEPWKPDEFYTATANWV